MVGWEGKQEPKQIVLWNIYVEMTIWTRHRVVGWDNELVNDQADLEPGLSQADLIETLIDWNRLSSDRTGSELFEILYRVCMRRSF